VVKHNLIPQRITKYNTKEHKGKSPKNQLFQQPLGEGVKEMFRRLAGELMAKFSRVGKGVGGEVQ
jgi:hypothetical protein